MHYLFICHLFPFFSCADCNEISFWDTDYNNDILYNRFHTDAGVSSEINVKYRVSVAKESTATERNTFLCVAQNTLKTSTLGIAYLWLMWAGHWLLEQMVVNLWMDEFIEFSSPGCQLLRLHQEGADGCASEVQSLFVQQECCRL